MRYILFVLFALGCEGAIDEIPPLHDRHGYECECDLDALESALVDIQITIDALEGVDHRPHGFVNPEAITCAVAVEKIALAAARLPQLLPE